MVVVGGGYRISNFLIEKELKKRGKKEVAASVLIKTIRYYENTKYALNRKKKTLHYTEIWHTGCSDFKVH